MEQATRRISVFLIACGLIAFLPGRAQEFVPGGDPEHPRVRYADGSVSENDRCIVRKVKLNPKNRPVYVNGRAVGFC